MSPQWRKWRNYLFNFTRAHYLERHNERHSRHCLELVPVSCVQCATTNGTPRD